MTPANTDRFMLCLCWGAYLTVVIASGGLASFIAGWQHGLVITAAVAFALLVLGAWWGGHDIDNSDQHQHATKTPTDQVLHTLVHCLPLFLITALGVTSLGGQAFSIGSGHAPAPAVIDQTPHELTLADITVDNPNLPDEVTLIGMAYTPTADDYLQLDGLTHTTGPMLLYRFQIICCAADAVAMYVAVQGIDGSRFANDTWLRVHGRLERPKPPSNRGVVHVTTVEVIPLPEEPYIRRKL